MRFKTVKLGELLDVLTDYHANGAYKKLKENVELLDEPDYAVMIRTTNFEQNDFASNLKYITEHAYNFLAKSKVYAGDIIMNKIANAGSSYLMPELDKPVSLAMNLFLLRINTEKANPTYVYIYLKIHEAYVKNFANGSVTKTITKEAVKNLEIQLPERSVQDSIVKIYFSLSDKIQLNQKTNQTLEQMAQAIFKSWFVDFEPTRAKVITKAQGADPATQELAAQAIICGAITLEQLQGYAEESVEESAQQREQESLSTRLQKAINEKLSQASANPLNATTAEQLIATAALFPSALVESELGEVPEGWELKPFSEYAKVTKGKNITKKNAVPGNVPVVAGGLLPAYWHNVHNVEGPVITISASGANAGYVNLYNQNIWSSDSSYIDKKSTSYFYTAYVCLKYYQKAIYDMQTGAAQPHIYPKDFERLNVVFGSDKLLEQLENLLFSFFEKTANLTNEAETLTQIRDTLLPKLLSGEITLAEEVKRS